MTYYDGDDEVVPELCGVAVMGDEEGGKGDYVGLPGEEAGDWDGVGVGTPRRGRFRKWRGCAWYWAKLIFLFGCLGVLAAACVKWVWPYLMDNDVIPVLNWETTTFSPPVLAVLVVASLAIFPSLLLPSSPSMWVSGMTFGYGYGFLLCISGMSVGVSIPYFIGSLFYHKIQGWMDKYPKRASLIRSAGGGNWFHQFRSVTLIRISPFPYMIYNYCAVATNVKFGPYFLGSLVGVVPEIFVTMYTGILIKALADASHDQRALSAPEIVFNVLGFLSTVAATVVFTIFAKRKLKALQKEDEPLQE
ncbi:hypothetical protein MLD38_038483 [Melastoma candidum]|uniref:Uncharacterized protein n=1 Tax=Melastoma candidum TaxID=119954 RepID=A0ACB9L0B1_9MYRT|nr:hypothetical protein MLD38_038483 [Melastoma candidum]